MAKIGVRLKINCSMIERARLFPGNKGQYLDATVFIDVDQKDRFDNNGMITQDVSKSEREAGVKGPILGNAQVFYRDDQQQAPAQQLGQQAPAQQPGKQVQNQPAGFNAFDDDLPF